MSRENPKFEILKAFPRGSSTSSLYLAGAGNVTKVGFSKSLRDRSKVLLVELEKISGSKFHGMVAFAGAGGVDEEAGLIRLMKSHFPVFKGNEYFKCSFDDAYPLVMSYCQQSRFKFLEAERRRYENQLNRLEMEVRAQQKSFDLLLQHVEEEKVFYAFK